MSVHPNSEQKALDSLVEEGHTMGLTQALARYVEKRDHGHGWNSRTALRLVIGEFVPTCAEDVLALDPLLFPVFGRTRLGAIDVLKESMEQALLGKSPPMAWALLLTHTDPDSTGGAVLDAQWFIPKFCDHWRARSPEWEPLWQQCWEVLRQDPDHYSIGDEENRMVFTMALACADMVRRLLEKTGGAAANPSEAVAREWVASADTLRKRGSTMALDAGASALEALGKRTLLARETGDGVAKPGGKPRHF